MELSHTLRKKICPFSEIEDLNLDLSSQHVMHGKSDSGLQYDIYCSLAELDHTAWDELVKEGSLFLSRPYLNALESCHDEELYLWYVIFSKDNQKIGAAVFQLVDFKSRPLGENLENGNVIVNLVAKQMGLKDKPLSYKLLVNGNCFATGENGFVFSDAIDGSDAVEALEDAVRMIQTSLKKLFKISGFFFKDFYPESKEYTSSLIKHSYTSFPSEASLIMTLDPDWTSFADYLGSMVSKFRVKAKRAYTKSGALECRDLTLEDLREHRERVDELYWNVVGKAGFRMGTMNTRVFEVLREEMGEEFLIKAYYLEGRMVGFMCGFIHGELMDATCVGIDYELNQEHSIYSRMLYDYVEIGIQNKVKSINFGRTAGEIKTTIGAVPVDMTCYLRHRKSLPNKMVGLVSKFIKPEKFPVRVPFKKTWYEKNLPEA